MKTNKLLLLVLFAIGTFSLQAQTRLHGTLLTKYLVNDTIHNSFDTIRISNQQVELYDKTNNKRFMAYTDTDGKFVFDDIQKGDYHLTINDPILKQKKSVLVKVQYEGKKNIVKPIVVDRVDQTLKVKKY